jgi:hypothetical protein
MFGSKNDNDEILKPKKVSLKGIFNIDVSWSWSFLLAGTKLA